jgi:hypothetical protein
MNLVVFDYTLHIFIFTIYCKHNVNVLVKYEYKEITCDFLGLNMKHGRFMIVTHLPVTSCRVIVTQTINNRVKKRIYSIKTILFSQKFASLLCTFM